MSAVIAAVIGLALAILGILVVLGGLAILVVLGAGAIARRRGSIDEHFERAAEIVREKRHITDEELAEWTSRWQEHLK